jgi:hypothetical protein
MEGKRRAEYNTGAYHILLRHNYYANPTVAVKVKRRKTTAEAPSEVPSNEKWPVFEAWLKQSVFLYF